MCWTSFNESFKSLSLTKIEDNLWKLGYICKHRAAEQQVTSGTINGQRMRHLTLIAILPRDTWRRIATCRSGRISRANLRGSRERGRFGGEGGSFAEVDSMSEPVPLSLSADCSGAPKSGLGGQPSLSLESPHLPAI